VAVTSEDVENETLWGLGRVVSENGLVYRHKRFYRNSLAGI